MANWPLLENMKSYIGQNWQTAGFQKPTPIQEKVIPFILEGRDLIAESPTGTGKTLAYVLPILERVDESIKGLQAVILVPSRELAMQILEEVRKFSKGTSVKAASFIGGANIKKQVEKLKEKPQIAVGTPGRMVELIKMKKMKMHQVKLIVIDEADQLVAHEHVKDVESVIKSTLKERQILFFSATMTKETERKATQLMIDPINISVEQNEQPMNIEHLYIACEQREKVDYLRKIMHTKPGRTIAFLKNTEMVEEVGLKLDYHGLDVAVLAGESKKLERKNAIKDFRSGKIPLLITTDVAARGLDIEDVEFVIHYDFPSTSTQYLHRSGRTGRMGKQGTVLSLVNAQEESFLKKMSQELNLPMNKKALYRGQIIDVK